MKAALLTGGLLLPLASAFPRAMFDQMGPDVLARAADIFEKRQSGADSAAKVFEPANTFNAKAQFVDVGPGSGHEYQAPSSSDLRGPCPGLK